MNIIEHIKLDCKQELFKEILRITGIVERFRKKEYVQGQIEQSINIFINQINTLKIRDLSGDKLRNCINPKLINFKIYYVKFYAWPILKNGLYDSIFYVQDKEGCNVTLNKLSKSYGIRHPNCDGISKDVEGDILMGEDV